MSAVLPGSEFQPEELHVRLFDVAFINVEHQPILQCYSHQVVQMFVVFGFCLPEHTHVVSNTYRSWALLKDAVHPLLEYVLAEVQAKRQSSETVPTEGTVERGQTHRLVA